MIRLGVLTSSRADFGFYLPLLKEIKDDDNFELEIIAFGTHLSSYHGQTSKEIEKEGFIINYSISSFVLTDDSASIATNYAITAIKFADFWSRTYDYFDYVFCIGDRYEMAAAVNSGIPFGIKFIHIGGGDTTLGAFDNIYRHQITLGSSIHLVLLHQFQKRINQICGNNTISLVTGSLSLENLKRIKLLNPNEFRQEWKIDLSLPSLLITIHPETIAYSKNTQFSYEAFNAFDSLANNYQLIITMPNADTSGTIFRAMYKTLKESHPHKVFLIENFGTQSYYSCMKYVGLILGNSSSGIIEAASLGKYVINIGDRQKGRLSSENTIHLPFNSEKIIFAVKQYFAKSFIGQNIYYQEDAVQKIISFLKQQL